MGRAEIGGHVVSTFQGRRLYAGIDYGEVRPGDYWRVLDRDGVPTISDSAGNLTGTCWMVAVPANNPFEGQKWMLGHLVHHTVREHEDGTVSVRPGDGSSNSILISDSQSRWHGYIERGVFQES